MGDEINTHNTQLAGLGAAGSETGWLVGGIVVATIAPPGRGVAVITMTCGVAVGAVSVGGKPVAVTTMIQGVAVGGGCVGEAVRGTEVEVRVG